jgi:ATP-dependent RNA helicase RhlE
MDDKRFFLERLIKENEGSRIIIFVRTKVRAERVAAAMIRVGIECLLIHGGKEQKDRELAISSFKKGQKRLLIATDVSARGIDIPSVDIVVNYDVPDVAENYVHRIGRTGRGVAKGIAYTFVSPDEKDLIADIEEYTTVHIPIINLDTQTYEEIKKIADPNSITISQVEDLINQIESNYNSWENDRKKQKKNNH